MTSLANPFMHFSALTDYRQTGKVTHKLSDFILLTVCGVLSEQDKWEGIVDFGEMRRQCALGTQHCLLRIAVHCG